MACSPPTPNALFGKVLNSPGCESWCLSSAWCLPPPVKALSHSIMTGKGQNAASANCYFKGKGNRPPLTPTMVHILSQWGSLMCEQGSGRAVNRAFYQAARGELGCQWRGLSHVCHVPTLGPGLFVLMAARDWRDLFTLDICQAGEPALHEKATSGIASEPQVWSTWERWCILVGRGSTGASGYCIRCSILHLRQRGKIEYRIKSLRKAK